MRWCRQLGALSAAGGCKTRDVARAVQHTGVRAPRRAWWHSPVRARGQALVEYCAFRCTRAPPREAARWAAGMRAPAPGGSAVAFSRGWARTAMPPRKHLAPRSASRSPDDGQMDRQMCEFATTPARSPWHRRWYLLRRCRRRRRRRRHRRRGARTRGELKKKYKLSHARAARASTHLCTRALLAERERDGAEALDGAQASGRVLMAQLIDQDRDGVQRVVTVGHAGSAARPPARCPPAPSPLPPALREARRARARARPRALPAPGRAGKRGGETASPPPPRALARATVAPGAWRGAGRGPTPPLPLPSARAREPLHWGGRLLYFDFRFFSTRVYVHLLLHERIAGFFLFLLCLRSCAPSVLSNLCCTLYRTFRFLRLQNWVFCGGNQTGFVRARSMDVAQGRARAELGLGDAGRRPAAAAGLRCARAREADGRGVGRWRPSRAQSGGSLVAGAAAHRRRGQGRREGRQR